MLCVALLGGACSDGAEIAPPAGQSGGGGGAGNGSGTGGAAGSSDSSGGLGGIAGAPPGDGGVDPDISIYVPRTLSQELASSDAVAELYGQPVRFVGLGLRDVIYADAADGSASLLVFIYAPSPAVFALPETHRSFRFRDLDHLGSGANGYYLACGYQRCALFESMGEDSQELSLIPNSEFSGGLRFRTLHKLDVRLCALGPDTEALCFDGETWTDEAGAPKDPEAVPGIDPPQGSNPAHPPPPEDPLADEDPEQCPAESEVREPLVASRLWYDQVVHAATGNGGFVFGAWDAASQTMTSCYYVSAEFGMLVDFEYFDCGLSPNPRLLTATKVVGPTDCAVGE